MHQANVYTCQCVRCFSKNDGIHVLNLLPVIVFFSLSTRLDTSKYQRVHSDVVNCLETHYKYCVFCKHKQYQSSL